MKPFNGFIKPKSPAHEEINSYGLSGSVARKKAINYKELRRFAAELMTTISQSLLRYGAKDIGHIKAYIEHDNGFLHADTLGDPADVTVKGRDGEPVNHFRLVVNSVIYGVAKETVIEATESSVTSVLLEYRFEKNLNREE